MNEVRIKNNVGIIFSWLAQDYSSINGVRIKNNVGIIFSWLAQDIEAALRYLNEMKEDAKCR